AACQSPSLTGLWWSSRMRERPACLSNISSSNMVSAADELPLPSEGRCIGSPARMPGEPLPQGRRDILGELSDELAHRGRLAIGAAVARSSFEGDLPAQDKLLAITVEQ